MLKVLATDGLSVPGLDVLRRQPEVSLDIRPVLDRETLWRELRNFQVVIVRSETRLDRELLEQATELELIIRAGIGVDNIDVAYATEKGILVANTPRGNAATIAEHTFAMIGALARHIPQADAHVRRGEWNRQRFIGSELRGKSLGIIGLGNIGSVVAGIGTGYGMEILAYDPFVSLEMAERHGAVKVESLDDLLAQSDFVSIHVPLNEATRGLIGAAALSKMRPTAYLINCARGGIVDEDALAEAVRARRIAGAALDTLVKEPPPPGHPLLGLENVIVTPCLATSTREAQEQVAVEASQLILEYVRYGIVSSAINAPLRIGKGAPRERAFLDLARKLGLLQGQLLDGAPERLTLEIIGDELRDFRELLLLGASERFLSAVVSHERINYVNVKRQAERRHIDLVDSVIKSSRHGISSGGGLLRLRVACRRGGSTTERAVAGTVFDEDSVRITEIDGYEVDLIPDGIMLLVRNQNRPGVIGRIGTLLGDHGINISRMAVTLREGLSDALGIYAVESPVPEEAMKVMTSWEFIYSVVQVRL
jgi:D-3-phosphoglycerate dehydrogenase